MAADIGASFLGITWASLSGYSQHLDLLWAFDASANARWLPKSAVLSLWHPAQSIIRKGVLAYLPILGATRDGLAIAPSIMKNTCEHSLGGCAGQAWVLSVLPTRRQMLEVA